MTKGTREESSRTGLGERLDRSFYQRDPVTVARELLGQRLVRVLDGTRLSGRIVETEAYLGVEDRAAHSFGGRRTARTETMYLDGGMAYVFLNYGVHYLLNVVTETTNQPSAVLLRAIEPLQGIEQMFAHRPAAKTLTQLGSGPGKLGAALRIDRTFDREDLVTSDRLFIERLATSESRLKIEKTARIGVDYAGEWAAKKLRFLLAGNEHVSRSR